MKTSKRNEARRGARGRRLAPAFALALCAGLLMAGCGGSDAEAKAASEARGDLWKIRHDSMTVSVLASGNIKARDTTTIKNKVPGSVKILWIIEEGKLVKKGDKLVDLEADGLDERLTSQRLDVSSAEASYEEAVGNLEIQESQNKTDLLSAENTLSLAKLDLDKYINGDYPQEKRTRETALTLAKAELKRAEDTYKWTQKLFEKGYVNRGELEADELSVTKTRLDQEQAEEDLRLLDTYEKPRQMSELKTSLLEAEEDLKRVKRSNENNLRTKKVSVDSTLAKFNVEKKSLSDLERDAANCVIYAPQDGMVVYAREGRRGEVRVEAGAEVSNQQRLIELPDFSAWQSETSVHESMVQQVREGQKVFITLDAFPGKMIEGVVGKVAVLPDNSNWFQPDIKEFTIEVDLTTTTLALKPGMSTKNEIIVDRIDDALLAPVQAVTMRNGKPGVELAGGTRREVKTGRNNDRFVEILDGLKEGDLIQLLPSSGTGVVTDRPSNRAGENGGGQEGVPQGETSGKKPGSPAPGGEGRQGPPPQAKAGETHPAPAPQGGARS